MISTPHFFSKQYTIIWLLLAVIFVSACGSPNAEPGFEPDIEINMVVPQVQQPYPPPEEQAQAAYPGPSFNATPVRPTLLPTPIPPPLCDIKPPVEIAMSYEEALPDFPVFSEPTIVATNGVGFSIAEWLPDNQRLLVAQGDGAFGPIFTLDVTTGEMVEYAQRRDLSGRSMVWLDEAQGVMFVEATAEGWELRFSDGQTTTTLANELASISLEKDPLSDQVGMLFSSEPGALMTIDPTGNTEFVTAKQLAEETKRVPLSSGDGYHLAWSPDGIWLAQYKGEDLYLINTQTQMICTVDLGDYGEAGRGSVSYVQWSPDGHVLSMAVKRQNPTPELNILDIDSMDLSILSVPLDTERWPPESIGALAWSPTDQTIFLQIGRYDTELGRIMAQWLLVDIHAHQYMDILPDYKFLPGVGNIVWSLDGSKVAYSCPTTQDGNICLVNISQ